MLGCTHIVLFPFNQNYIPGCSGSTAPEVDLKCQVVLVLVGTELVLSSKP